MKRKIKSILCTMLTVAMIVTLAPSTANAEEENVIEISNVTELKAFRDAVNAGNNYLGKVVKLTADINLAEEATWTPIGNNTNYFKGTFDGDNHTISNMTIDVNTPDTDQFAGLFGGVQNAVIKNLTMKNTSITAVGKKVRAAAVVGIADSDKSTPAVLALNFENITVDGCTINAEAKSGSALLGGVIGYSYPTNMKGITVSGLTINGKAEGQNEVRAAAINGYVCGQNISNNGNTRMAFDVDTFNVKNVEISADAYTVFAGGYAPYTYYGYITLKDGTIDGLKIKVEAHEAFVGGLVGYFWRSDNGHTVNNVKISGIDFDVTTDYLGETRVGGMVGTSQSPNTKYTDCSVSGKIVEHCSDSENPVNYHAKVGGFVARTYEYAQQTYTNCVADVDVTGSNIAGGFVGNHNSTVSYVNCEAKGDVTADIAGGFAGRLTEHGYTTDVTFDGCKVSGNVEGTNVAGGFIGSTANHGWAAWAEGNGAAYGKNITLKDCEITGKVTCDNEKYLSGVVGEVKVNGRISISNTATVGVNGNKVTLPDGGTVNPDGSITVPTGGTIEVNGNKVTLPEGGTVTVDKDDNVVIDPEGTTVKVEGIGTVTLSEDGDVSIDKDGNVKLDPVGGSIDIDGDGDADVNIDTNGDGTPDINVDTDGNGKPDINIDTNGDNTSDVNVDTDGDGKADINIDTDGDGTSDVNVDTDGNGKPDINIDTNGDGTSDINVDTDKDGDADINIDTDGNGKADVNVDTDGNNKADVNIDTDGDGKADLNVDTDGDGKADANIDADGDGKVDANIDTNGDGDADSDSNTDDDEDVSTDESEEGSTPETGDSANIMGYLITMIAAVAVAILAVIKRRKA